MHLLWVQMGERFLDSSNRKHGGRQFEILMIFIAGLGVILTRVWRMPPTTKIGYYVYSSDEMSMRADIWYHHSGQFHSELRSRALHFILWVACQVGISTSDLRELLLHSSSKGWTLDLHIPKNTTLWSRRLLVWRIIIHFHLSSKLWTHPVSSPLSSSLPGIHVLYIIW